MKTLWTKLMGWIFRRCGWRVIGSIPEDIPKAILVGGGHTSNWDLFGTLGTLTTLDKKFHFLIKKEALRFPVKSMLTALGAIPVERNTKGGRNMVQQVADFLAAQSTGYICIAPEGTRRAVDRWKSGFYHIAKRAQVPMILCYLDYTKKQAVVGKVVYPTESEEKTMVLVREYFRRAVPKYAQNFKP